MKVVFAICILALAACGADGDPTPPGSNEADGEITIGVVGAL
jgi:hypothetical protein